MCPPSRQPIMSVSRLGTEGRSTFQPCGQSWTRLSSLRKGITARLLARANPPFLPIMTCLSPNPGAYLWHLLWLADCCSCFFQYSLALAGDSRRPRGPYRMAGVALAGAPRPASLPSQVALGRGMPGPAFSTRETGQGKNPALTFIKETRWVAQDAAASPEAKQGWGPTTWPCFALSCSLSPRILLVATKAQAEGALGDWTLLLICF